MGSNITACVFKPEDVAYFYRNDKVPSRLWWWAGGIHCHSHIWWQLHSSHHNYHRFHQSQHWDTGMNLLCLQETVQSHLVHYSNVNIHKWVGEDNAFREWNHCKIFMITRPHACLVQPVLPDFGMRLRADHEDAGPGASEMPGEIGCDSRNARLPFATISRLNSTRLFGLEDFDLKWSEIPSPDQLVSPILSNIGSVGKEYGICSP